jgi:hypothetical protein
LNIEIFRDTCSIRRVVHRDRAQNQYIFKFYRDIATIFRKFHHDTAAIFFIFAATLPQYLIFLLVAMPKFFALRQIVASIN